MQKQVSPGSAFVPPDKLPLCALEVDGAFHGPQSEQSLVATVKSAAREHLGGRWLGGCFHLLADFDNRNHTSQQSTQSPSLGEEFRLSF